MCTLYCAGCTQCHARLHHVASAYATTTGNCSSSDDKGYDGDDDVAGNDIDDCNRGNDDGAEVMMIKMTLTIAMMTPTSISEPGLSKAGWVPYIVSNSQCNEASSRGAHSAGKEVLNHGSFYILLAYSSTAPSLRFFVIQQVAIQTTVSLRR